MLNLSRHRRWALPAGPHPGAVPARPALAVGEYGILAAILAVTFTLWQHGLAVLTAPGTALTDHLPSAGLDAMLSVPAAAVAAWLATRLGARLGLGPDRYLLRAALISLCCVPAFAPLAAALPALHGLLAGSAGTVHSGHAAGLAVSAGTGLGGLVLAGLRGAAIAQPVLLVAALLGGALLAPGPRERRNTSRRRRLLAGVGAVTAVIVFQVSPGPLPAFAAGPVQAAAATTGCTDAPTRTYNVLAINVDITVDRFGDHDPFGFMYVLRDRLSAVRAQEAALKAAASIGGDPDSARVSSGLGQDAIQPLVLRARLGECVVINLTNNLTQPPKGGPGFNAIPVSTQPGGVPSVSVDMQGVAYDAANGLGGNAVGNNPAAVMVPPGGTRGYQFFLDPLMGEGAKVFRSGGDSAQLTAHGLFGALVAEPAGSRWLDPDSGTDRTTDTAFNSFAAIIQPGSGTSFREFAIIYHEIGDEMFNLRRPPREDGGDTNCFDDPDGQGAPLPMLDEGGINNCGTDTDSYRPASRALNYRSEPFFRRLELLVQTQGADDSTLPASESLMYGSYLNGDPATPMPRSYVGEPTKTRLMHAGFEQLHVHHLHGGGDRWPQNPRAQSSNFAGGLQKTPPNNTPSINLDSQTIGPGESFNLEHECGAGGCQQAVGDFLYHCHIAHHYIAGMWGFWRVFDTRQANLAVIPGRTAPPTAVSSAGLVGRTIGGRSVVTRSTLTNSATQVAVEDLVEGQIPPQGVRNNDTDATVWDWVRTGPATAPVYQGEPEDATGWANYTSPTPGARPTILFNPNNGRPAWPLLRPHLGQRPPFSPAGHAGAPYLGNTASSTRPDGLCPSAAPVRTYNVTAISVPIQETDRERDPDGEVFVLNPDKDRVLSDAASGARAPDPLVIRSNVGDCVALTLSSELDPAVQQKVNMHTHFVQFDPQASDGVITGFGYEQSVYSDQRESRTSTAAAAAGSGTVTVSNTTGLRVGIFIGVGVGRPNIEVRKITAISGNRLTFDAALGQAHASGEPVTVEFVQYRWYSDVDSGTVFWHDHVNGIKSWAHGLFGAHIIEPRGSTYHNPQTGATVSSGPIVDIHTTSPVGVGVSTSFREYMIFLGNGRRGRAELTSTTLPGPQRRNAGQECEEGMINLRAAPIGERSPTALQRQEFNGEICRNATSRANDPAAANTVAATVSTVDPYVFSSVKYGDPRTPLLRAYAGDPVVIRTLGINERVEALRVQGHRFRRERFNADGELVDAASTGISERFDYVLDGGAGGPRRMAGDYLYYSTRTFAFETGAWGIFRVHDHLRSDLRALPGQTAPPGGAGFPLLNPATGNTQASPGPNPPPASQAGVVSSTASPCASGAPNRPYDISVLNAALPTAPTADAAGIIYALTSDVAAIRAGTKRPEPLVLRANQGDCVRITLRDEIAAGTAVGGTRAGFDLGKLLFNPQTSAGTAVGLNPDTTVAAGGNTTLTFAADKSLGTAVFQNLGSTAAVRHGAYGLLIVEPTGSQWFNSADAAPLTATRTSAQAIIRPPGGGFFREFALSAGTTDQQYARSIVDYQDVVAGAGVNSQHTAFNRAVANRGFSNISYSTAPLTTRLGLNSNPPNPNAKFGQAFSSAMFGDPATPLFRAYAGDPVVFRVGAGASDQFMTFGVHGHAFPQEPNMFNGGSDQRSQVLAARSLTGGETMEVKLVGGAGGTRRYAGDYLYGDNRQPFTEAGMWGIFRVLPSEPTVSTLARL